MADFLLIHGSCHDARCWRDDPPETVRHAHARLCAQPIAPQVTPLTIGNSFATGAKSLIRTAHDHTIPPEYQIEMTRHWPADTVHTMPTSHSPFFADPPGLARHRDTIARRL